MKKYLILLVATSFLFACQKERTPKYIFYFIGDGMGVNQVLGTQMYLAEKQGRIGTEALSFTQFPYVSMVSTYSQYNAVTCSAASGTALATGVKTRKGAIGMDSLLQNPLYSMAYRAKRQGKKVGIATTVSIDHATPASFYAHQPDRNMGYEIALDAARSGFDFFAGSGFSQCRKTGSPDIVSVLSDSGYLVVRGYTDFVANKMRCEKVVLLQNDSLANLPFAVDRREGDLTLKEMTQAAIDHLDNDGAGFFVMLEGGLIDWACHSNDAATAFREVEDLSDAVALAVDFYNRHPDETLIVVTADHETGGLVLGMGDYCLKLKLLENQVCSLYELTQRIARLRNEGGLRTWQEMRLLLSSALGFGQRVPWTEEEERHLETVFMETMGQEQFVSTLYADNERLAQEAVSLLNKKSKVGWVSYGHSAGFVPVYGIGVGAESVGTVRDNTDLYKLFFQ